MARELKSPKASRASQSMMKSIPWIASAKSMRALDDFRFIWEQGGLAGWIQKDIPVDMLKPLLHDPEGFLNVPRSQILRDKPKTKVVKQSLTTPCGGKRDVVIKRFQYPSLWRRMGFLVAASPAVRSLKGALLLQRNGIATPQPLAVLQHRRWRNLGTSYYIAEEIRDGQTLDAFWSKTLSTRQRKQTVRERCRILKEVALLFFRLHSRGIYHPDCKGANIFVSKQGEDSWQCSLVDLDGMRQRKRLTWRRRIKNLVQLQRTFGQHLNRRERVYLVKRYADLFFLERARRRALVGQVLSAR